MKPSKLSVALSLFLVFLSGVVVGGLAHRFYALRAVEAAKARPSQEWRTHYIEEMRSRLNLSDSQVQKLNQILDNTRSRYREVREKIQQEQAGQIRATLSDAQRVEYEKLRQEREKRRAARRNHSH